MIKGLQNLIEEHGSVRALAYQMQLSDVYLGRVLKRKEIPPNLARDLEFLARGNVTAEELCPSIFKPRWTELRKMPVSTQNRIKRLSRPKGR